MADDTDKESRSEEATEKRIAEAVERGNTPVARDVTLFGSIAAILAALLTLGRWSAGRVSEALQVMLDHSGVLHLEDRESAAILLTSALIAIGSAVLPFMLLVASGTVAASLMQNLPSAVPERIRPRADRISPAAGWARLFGRAGWVEFSKSMIKLTGVAALTGFLIRGGVDSLTGVLSADPRLLPGFMLDHIVRILTAFAVLALALGVIDMAWSRFKWRRDLRMTRHEIKEEMKQAEGDPYIKARIRNIARQRSSRRMLEKLPGASMVIVNPTHYAIALRYAAEEAAAPVVVAKGVDFLAQRIREIAQIHDVPLIENKPLARALYDRVEIDTQIPAEFYRVVAEILHFLNSRKRLPRLRS